MRIFRKKFPKEQRLGKFLSGRYWILRFLTSINVRPFDAWQLFQLQRKYLCDWLRNLIRNVVNVVGFEAVFFDERRRFNAVTL